MKILAPSLVLLTVSCGRGLEKLDTALLDSGWCASPVRYYDDLDGDGYGNSSTAQDLCWPPSSAVTTGSDCDDSNTTVNPTASEYCDGVDNDCDGDVDEADSLDVSTWFADSDGDGLGDPAVTFESCTQPAGTSSNARDCDDRSPVVGEGMPEVCDGKDNDCDGVADEPGGVVDGDVFFEDADSDGLGHPGSTIFACELVDGYSLNDWDCDDLDPGEPLVADSVSGSSSGVGTLDSPFASLQSAINAAGSCVIALAGTYGGIELGSTSLDIWGVEGPEETFIDGGSRRCTPSSPTGCETAVSIDSGTGATPTLRGFTIRGGSGRIAYSSSSASCADSDPSHGGRTTCTVNVFEYCGGGLYIDGDDPVLEDLVIEDNALPAFDQVVTGSWVQTWQYSYGGGACIRDSLTRMSDVMIRGNQADQGGALHVGTGGALFLEESMVVDNLAGDGGAIAVDEGAVSATNVVLGFNIATTDGGGVFVEDGSVELLNVTVGYNRSSTVAGSRGDALYLSAAGDATLSNTILQAAASNPVVYGSSLSTSFCDVYNAGSGGTFSGGSSAGGDDILTDPAFLDVTDDGDFGNDNWHLSSASPCLDGGDPSISDPDGSRSDVGAYGGPGGSW